MEKRQRFWWWLATAVLFLLGLFLVWRVNHRGWLLVALGTVYLGALYATGRGSAVSNSRLARWALLGISLLVLVLVVILGVILPT
jgi:hypothetical protein